MTAANTQQLEYAKALAARAGLTLDRAALDTFGRTVPPEKLTTRQASMLISQLKTALGEPAKAAGAVKARQDDHAPVAAPAPPKPNGIAKLLSPSRMAAARQLRAIHEGAEPRPANLDDDAAWLLQRLDLADRLEKEKERGRRAGVNGRGPIEMEGLLTHFGSWDRLAEAFGVTVPTAKAWGKHLPAARAYEAEVKTGGWVKAPR